MTGSDRRGAAPDDLPALFERYRETGDRAARNEIVERHRSLADGVARRYRARGIAVDDLRQTALLAMVRAVDRYEPGHGASFATFAGRTMEGELKRSLRDRSWAVRPPRATQERYLEVRRRDEELTHQLGRAPTVAETADAMDVTVDEVLEALEAGGARGGVPLTRPGDDGSEVEIGALLGEVDAGFVQADDRLLVEGLLDELDPRARRAIELRFYDRLGQSEIADLLGVSQSYLSRLLRKALLELQALIDASDAVGARGSEGTEETGTGGAPEGRSPR